MSSSNEILYALKSSKKFFEGPPPPDRKCSCEKCIISLYRHTHEPELSDPRHSFWDYLRFCIDNVPNPSGLWMEFGVGSGSTLNFIARHAKEHTIYGFDSFHGLPEEWRMSDERIYPKYKYSRNGVAPSLEQQNIQIITGYFDQSLPDFLSTSEQKCSFLHIDCDLYSSTIGIFRDLFKLDRIVAGTVILFDEFYNYKYFENHEFRAFREMFVDKKIAFRWLAHTESQADWNGNQAALLIL